MFTAIFAKIVTKITPFLLYIKLAAIAALCIACSYFTHKYQSNKYEAILANVNLVAEQALTKAQQESRQQENKNSEYLNKINSVVLERNQVLADLRVANAKYLDVNGRLRFKDANCSDSSNITSTAPNIVAQASSVAGDSQCSLPEAASRFIVNTTIDADTLKLYADTAYDYIQQVEAWRKEQNKENK